MEETRTECRHVTQFSVRTVQPVKAATVDSVACLHRAHVTPFDTGEMILVPVLDSKTNASRVRGAILSAQREGLVTKIDVQ